MNRANCPICLQDGFKETDSCDHTVTERATYIHIDWSKPIEAAPRENGLSSRPAHVLGEHKGAIEFVDVRIDGDDFFDPPGDYAACKTSGFIRGKLTIRNV